VIEAALALKRSATTATRISNSRLGDDEAREALGEWVARHCGELRTEMFQPRRSPGSMFRPAAHEMLILVLPDDKIPDE
jgi:hypothetical protein